MPAERKPGYDMPLLRLVAPADASAAEVAE